MYFQQPRPIAAFIQVEIGLSQILLQIYFFGTIVFYCSSDDRTFGYRCILCVQMSIQISFVGLSEKHSM